MNKFEDFIQGGKKWINIALLSSILSWSTHFTDELKEPNWELLRAQNKFTWKCFLITREMHNRIFSAMDNLWDMSHNRNEMWLQFEPNDDFEVSLPKIIEKPSFMPCQDKDIPPSDKLVKRVEEWLESDIKIKKPTK